MNILLSRFNLYKFIIAITVPLLFLILVKQVSAEVPHKLWGDAGVTLDTQNSPYQVNNHSIASDGEGGAYVAWIRSPLSGDPLVYVQRVDGAGVAYWTDGGVRVTDSINSQNNPVMVQSNADEVIVVWSESDGFAGSYLFAQKLDADGNRLWGTNGVNLTGETGGKTFVKLVSDGNGGAIAVWNDYRDAAFADIYAQKIDTDGNIVWDTAGEAVYSSLTAGASVPYILGDNNGGVYVGWSDPRAGVGEYDVYIQQIDTSGNAVWTANGELVNDISGQQGVIGLEGDYSDATPDVYVAIEDQENGVLLAQKVDGSLGTTLWAAEGITVSQPGSVSFPFYEGTVSDGQDGFFIAWDDANNSRIRGQRVNPDGSFAWGANGIILMTEVYPFDLEMINTNGTDIMILWDDYTNDEDDNEVHNITAQYIDEAGDVKWGSKGLSVMNGLPWADQNYPVLVNDDDIGGIVAWRPDNPDTGDYNFMMVQRISHAYQIANLESDLDAEDDIGRNIELGTPNGLVGTGELIRVKTNASDLVLSDVLADMIQDQSWTNVLGDADLSLGKAVITGITSAPGANSEHTLYVPYSGTSDRLVICPDAQTLSEVTVDCENAVIFMENETKVVNSNNVTVTKETIDAQTYWKAEGVTGTGGWATTAAQLGTLAATGIDTRVVTGVALLLMGISITAYSLNLKKGY